MPRALAAEEAGDEAAVIPLTLADLLDDPDTWRPTLEKGGRGPGAANDRALARVLTKAARGVSPPRRDTRPQERLWELWRAAPPRIECFVGHPIGRGLGVA